MTKSREVDETKSGGTENPRIGGSIPSLGTTFKPASIKSLCPSISLRNLPEISSKYPRCVPNCACENPSATNSTQHPPESC